MARSHGGQRLPHYPPKASAWGRQTMPQADSLNNDGGQVETVPSFPVFFQGPTLAWRSIRHMWLCTRCRSRWATKTQFRLVLTKRVWKFPTTYWQDSNYRNYLRRVKQCLISIANYERSMDHPPHNLSVHTIRTKSKACDNLPQHQGC